MKQNFFVCFFFSGVFGVFLCPYDPRVDRKFHIKKTEQKKKKKNKNKKAKSNELIANRYY